MGFGIKGKGKTPYASYATGKGPYSAPAQSWGTDSWGKGKDMGKGKKGGKFSTTPFKKVWVGGLPETEATDKELNIALKEHCKHAGNCVHVNIGKSGSGMAAFGTEEEAQAAPAILNGSVFQGVLLEVDSWTRTDGSAFERKY